MDNPIKVAAIAILDRIVAEKAAVLISVISNKSEIYSTYHDASGQRQSYLTHYTYSIEQELITPEHDHTTFVVRRHCTFINSGDENKENAVLGVLRLGSDIIDKDITISSNRITVKDLHIIYKL